MVEVRGEIDIATVGQPHRREVIVPATFQMGLRVEAKVITDQEAEDLVDRDPGRFALVAPGPA